jgi:hypothetical protein
MAISVGPWGPCLQSLPRAQRTSAHSVRGGSFCASLRSSASAMLYLHARRPGVRLLRQRCVTAVRKLRLVCNGRRHE